MSEGNVAQGEAVLTWNGNAVAQLTNIEFSGSTSDIDYTNNDSPLGTGEFIPGKRDPGTVKADFVASSTNASALHTDWLARSVNAFSVDFWESGFEKVGEGFISEFSVTAGLTGESVVQGTMTIRIKSDEAAAT